jgi:glyoxylase-like metal-dependent hydrolase (beta-lactamase superfamily II)/rhodanese-related sulfurtransferase
MILDQIYTGCLAQGAYYIESKGEALVIDPLRETRPYLEKAEKNQAEFKYILETHFHADFVSGHIDLARKTGAKIVYGPNANPDFDAYIAKDQEELILGDLKIRVLHTPGHTMESTSYLLIDEKGKETALFTGDTLFIGDVGRPDLAIKTDLSREDLAGHLFDSLRNNIMPLSDDILVYPGHGAGSACGKNMSTETVDTLGNQKKVNYALRADMSKEEFVAEVTDGLLPPPSYFPKNAIMNKMGYESIDDVMERGLHALSPDAFEAAANETGAVLLDTRSPASFVKGFIPNSISIGIDDNFAPWVGALITDIKQPILLITDEDRQEEVVTRLARVGYDHAIGFLKGGFAAWEKAKKEVDSIESISADEFAKRMGQGVLEVVDVRRIGEYEKSHLPEARLVSLDYLNNSMSSFKNDRKTYLHCAGGYRSVIAASILKARGFHQIVNVEGGFGAISKTNLKTVEGEAAKV